MAIVCLAVLKSEVINQNFFMQRFIVKLVHRIICGSGEHIPQFDEQLILIEATDHQHAYEKAFEIGKHGETAFINQQQQMVAWQFVNVVEIINLHSQNDGAEIFSRIVEVYDATAYCTLVNESAQNLFHSIA